MNISHIKDEIDRRISALEANRYKYHSGYKECKECLDKSSFKDATNFIKVDLYDYIKFLLFIGCNFKKPLDECDQDTKHLKKYSDYISSKQFGLLFELFFYLLDRNSIDDLIDYLQEKISFKEAAERIYEKDDHLFKEDTEKKEKLKIGKIISYIKKENNNCDILKTLSLIKENRSAMIKITVLIKVRIEVDEYLRDNHTRKETERYFKKRFNQDRVNRLIMPLRDFITDEEQKMQQSDAEIQKETNRMMRSYEFLIESLMQGEIKNAKKIIKGLKDEKLKKMFLIFIYEHNNKYYELLKDTYENQITKNSDEYQKTLEEYGITIIDDNIDKIKHHTIIDFKYIISLLKKMINNDNDIIYILEVTDRKTTETINEYSTNGYLNYKFINENLSIFNIQSKDNIRLINNIETLIQYGINPQNFYDSNNVLLTESSLFQRNLQILKDYNLLRLLRNTKNISFIMKEDLQEIIDRYIELGLKNILEETLEILNKQNIDRLYLKKSLNMPINDIDTINRILDKKTFVIDDELIKDYIPNIVPHMKKRNLPVTIDDLETYRIDNLTYRIAGVLFSSIKVQFLLNKGYDMYDSLFYNTYITIDEYQNIMDTLLSKVKTKQ